MEGRNSHWRLLAGMVVICASSLSVGAVEDEGKTLFVEQKCNTCHAVKSAEIEAKAKSEKMKGPDLTGVISKDDDFEQWVRYLRKQEPLDGVEHKKASKAPDEELRKLLAWLATQEPN